MNAPKIKWGRTQKAFVRSVEDFKAHIAAIQCQTNPDAFVKTDRPCVRKPTDRGYYAPPRTVGSGQRTIQQNDSTVIVERPKGGK